MERAECGFCGTSGSAVEMVRGRKTFICGACTATGMRWIIDSRGKGAGRELPEADAPCPFCTKKVPGTALYRGNGDSAICSNCLGRGYWFLAENSELQKRQQTWGFLDEKSPSGMLRSHFEKVGIEGIVTSSRTFPAYMRVDLNRTLEALIPKEARCIGLHEQYGHETLHYAKLISREERVAGDRNRLELDSG